jgi:tRNA pseudouridine32 synthase/23S rRNA pseudouridine746 synthase
MPVSVLGFIQSLSSFNFPRMEEEIPQTLIARKTADELSDTRVPPLPEDYKIPVIYRDDEIMVVNKPYDVRVDGRFPVTVEKLIRTGLGIDVDKFRLCNQLDAATSGVMVVGLTQKGAGNCGKLFSKRLTEKFYLAVCEGGSAYPLFEPIRITAKIFEPKDGDFKMYIDEEKGKESETIAVPLITGLRHINGTEQKNTLFLIKLLTGRRHQIRLHMKHIGSPILGDATYGQRREGVNRMMLHAWKLVLPYSDTKRICLSAPPNDICETLGFDLHSIEKVFETMNNDLFRVDMRSIGVENHS